MAIFTMGFGLHFIQLYAQVTVPKKGSYWLRTGILDGTSRKVGTMEIPLSAVVPLQRASK